MFGEVIGTRKNKWMKHRCSCNNNTNNITNIWSRFSLYDRSAFISSDFVPDMICLFVVYSFRIIFLISPYGLIPSTDDNCIIVLYLSRFRVSPTCRLLSDKCVCDRLDNYSATTPNNSHLAAGPSQSLICSSHRDVDFETVLLLFAILSV